MRRGTGLAGVLLLGIMLAGCTPAYEPEPGPEPLRAEPLPSSTASAVRADLLTALRSTNATTFRFAMNTNTAEGGTVTATGTVDPAGRRYETTTVVTGSQTQNYTLVIVGVDSYVKQSGERSWIHLDMSRVVPASPVYVDTGDPAGLGTFIADIERAAPVRRDATGWSGEFHPGGQGEYLPIGSPVFNTIAGDVPFTVTVDAQGLVTSIVIRMELTSGPEITMTTTISGHGAAVAIRPPPKGSTREADDMYYTK